MEPGELLAAAERKLGVSGDTALAEALREMGLDGFHTPQKIARWRRGENKPDFDATLALLRAAGLLRTSGRAPTLSVDLLDQVVRAIEAIQEQVSALVVQVEQLREQPSRRSGSD